MAKSQLKDFNTDLSGWFNDVVLKAELADYAPIKGCMVIRPYGYALWENIQKFMDPLIKNRELKMPISPYSYPCTIFKKKKNTSKVLPPYWQ